ncbi:MAG TPA: GNAT family N-acetyltransferase, partial [Acidobacteriaceae bacterium]|nr:GNAT family N-acetyltransferase [Acidobacteriaceae bacterium]
ILGKGGHIYLASAGHSPVGCVALLPMGDGVFELSKMAVTPAMRGRGIGRRLLQHAIEAARLLGGRALFLGSSTRLPDAIHLYEAVGFRHLAAEEIPDLAYSRADVFMRLVL